MKKKKVKKKTPDAYKLYRWQKRKNKMAILYYIIMIVFTMIMILTITGLVVF